jgi:hypothetical protein
MANPDTLTCSSKFKYYSTNAADIDLVAEGKTVCRAIRANASGVVSLLSDHGDTETIPFAPGETQFVRCSKILTSGTTSAIGLTVFW